MNNERYNQIIDEAYENYTNKCVLFDDFSDGGRITRTIIGLSSSTDITSWIDPESDWGAVDYLTNDKIKYEDCDSGLVYVSEKMVKFSSLKEIGIVGLRCESMYELLNESNFVFSKEEFIAKCKTDQEFSEMWGLKIKEKELSLDERCFIARSNHYEASINIKINLGIDEDHTLHKQLDDIGIATKLITLTYQNESIQFYE
jgi:hypothetical protein